MAAPVCAYANANRSKPKERPTCALFLQFIIYNTKEFLYEDFVTSNLPDSNWGMDGFEKMALLIYSKEVFNMPKITTVSPTYASEIRTIEYGCGLEQSLQYRSGSCQF